MAETKALIKDLNYNALYKISMSSIELFHSNFWVWMFTKYKESIPYFFEGIATFEDETNLIVKREHRNLDISIIDENYLYIIENKIKSLPSKKQLDKYSNRRNFNIGIITSIVKTDFSEINNEEEWVYLDYFEIGARISKFKDDYILKNSDYDRFDFDLIDRYYKMIQDISTVVQNELRDKEKYHFDTDLGDIGFDVVYKKLLGSRLKHQFLNHNRFKHLKPYLITDGVDASINRTKLTFSVYLLSKEPNTHIGIQLEHYQYRRFIKIIHNPKQYVRDRSHKKEISQDYFSKVKPIYDKWFQGHSCNQYVTEGYTFIYQKREPITPGESFESLIERVITDLDMLVSEEYVRKIQ